MEKKITSNKKSTNTTQSTNIQSETQKQKDETQKKKAIAISLAKDTQMPSSAKLISSTLPPKTNLTSKPALVKAKISTSVTPAVISLKPPERSLISMFHVRFFYLN
jgi:hypothetical protein